MFLVIEPIKILRPFLKGFEGFGEFKRIKLMFTSNSFTLNTLKSLKRSLKKSFYKLISTSYRLNDLQIFNSYFHKLNKSFYRPNNRFYKLKSQKGVIEVVGLVLGIVLVLLMAIALFLLVLLGDTSSPEEDVAATVKNNDTNNAPTNNDTNNLPKNNDTNQVYKPEEGEELNLGYLVCVNLPGIKANRTPALDVRVARRYLAVKQDLDAQGVSTVSFTWAFRTNCQQVNVHPSGNNPKATPGTSPHEAGRALDVVGLDPSSGAFRKNDWFKIVTTFRAHGWRWLARKDPPHMDIDAAQVGERSNYIWIQKSQADYKKGGPKGGCRGPECAS